MSQRCSLCAGEAVAVGVFRARHWTRTRRDLRCAPHARLLERWALAGRGDARIYRALEPAK